MTLAEFMESAKLNDRQLAEKVGVTRGYITQLRHGLKPRPSLPVAIKIAEVSGGLVPVTAWEPKKEKAA